MHRAWSGGLHALAGLGQVAFDGRVRGWAVFDGGGVSQAGPCLDGLEPGGGLDGTSGHGVQEANEFLRFSWSGS